MKAVCFSVLFLATLAFASSSSEEFVTTLTRANFYELINDNHYTLVLFYNSSWLTKNPLLRNYPKLAQNIIEEYPGIKVCKMNISDYEYAAILYNVTEFPTLKLIAKKEALAITYTGKSNFKSINSWLKQRIESLISPVKSLENLEELISNNEHIVLYLGSNSSETYSDFLASTSFFNDITFLKSTSKVIKKKYGVTENGLVVIRDHGQEENTLKTLESLEDITKFMSTYKAPIMRELSWNTFSQIKKETDIMILVNSYDQAGVQASEAFQMVAEELRGKIAFGVVSADEGPGPYLLQIFGFDSDLPAVAILHSTSGGRKYRFDREITPKNLKIFFSNFLEKNLVDYLRSAPLPDEPYDGLIRVAVGTTYKQIVMDETKDVLIEFYSPHCGHCIHFAPVYKEFSETMKDTQDLLIVKMDVTVNDADGVERYPTIRFYPRGKKDSPVEIVGGQTIETMIRLIKDNGTVDVKV